MILDAVLPRSEPCIISIEQPDMPQNPQTSSKLSFKIWNPICFLMFLINNCFSHNLH